MLYVWNTFTFVFIAKNEHVRKEIGRMVIMAEKTTSTLVHFRSNISAGVTTTLVMIVKEEGYTKIARRRLYY